ncbi:MAG: CAP domain-containing protein [Paracoccus sp. (in: a-proteobacteria)]|nr:CAP domain-containing protein [Paracoccus sp. (in: a-proteobacteria)]
MKPYRLMAVACLALGACGPLDTITIPPVGLPGQAPYPAATPQEPAVAPDGRYVITQAEADAIPQRVLDQVNMLRAGSGAPPLVINPSLQSAAAAHSRDMSRQNRAWHFGSDGSSPFDRVRRAGYQGTLVGEDIAESFETDIQTLSAWMANRSTRDVIMDPQARELGVAWYQEPDYKIWWTILIGR